MSSTQLYYYTSTWKAIVIRRDGRIRKTNNRIRLTNMKPEDHSKNQILRCLYGNLNPKICDYMVGYVVPVDRSKLDNSKIVGPNNNVFTYTGDIDVNPRDVMKKPKCIKGGNGSGGQMVYYHYTNTAKATQIKTRGRIRTNGGIVILTTLKPEHHYRDELLKIIYGKFDANKFGNMADWCVVIRVSRLDTTKLKPSVNLRDVYYYSGDIVVKQSDVIDKPKCTKAIAQEAVPSTWKSGDHDKYLYHYTDKVGANGIKSSGFIKKSGPSGAFGPGVYMTDRKPTNYHRDDIMKNNYGGISSTFKQRADWLVRVDISKLDKSKLKKVSVPGEGHRSIYVYPDQIAINPSDVLDKPKCHRAN